MRFMRLSLCFLREYKRPMDFRILGPLEVVDDGERIPLEASKPRALLGVLLPHPNEVVSRERLIDELWGEQPPATAAKVVQTYISQLSRGRQSGAARGRQAL
jgi:DNA-binding SARP family transcriptional activator